MLLQLDFQLFFETVKNAKMEIISLWFDFIWHLQRDDWNPYLPFLFFCVQFRINLENIIQIKIHFIIHK